MTTPSTDQDPTRGAVGVVRRVGASVGETLGRLSWTTRGLLLLGAAALVARAPGMVYSGLFNRDEAFMQVMGRVMGSGGSLYVDVIDRKPPLAPFAYRVAQMVSMDLRVVRLLVALAVLVNGLLVMALVRRLTDDRRAALAAGLLAVLGTAMFLPADGQAANFELWAVAPATGAVLAAVWARRSAGRALGLFAVAGFLAAIALNFKQPFVVVLVPVGLEALRSSHRVARATAALAGTVAGIASMALLVNLSLMWKWVWLDNGDYLNGGLSFVRAAGVGVLMTVLFMAFQWPLLYGLVDAVRRRRWPDLTMLTWLVVSIAVIGIGFRFYEHYYQQVVPPLAVLSGVALAGATHRARKIVLSGAAAMSLVAVLLAFVFPPELTNLTAIHRYIAANTASSDRVLVWGAMPDIYVAADRYPSGIFLHGGYLTGNWADRTKPLPPSSIAEPPYRNRWRMFLDNVVAHPPELIIDAAQPGTDWAHYPPDLYPLGTIIRRCYRPVPPVDGFPIWRRDPVACPSLAGVVNLPPDQS